MKSSFFGRFGKSQGRHAKRKPAVRRPSPMKLVLEELENRTLLSVIPAATPGTPQNLSGQFDTGVDPQAVYNPTNPKVIVEFNTAGPANTPAAKNDNIPTDSLEGRYSTDGGQTWNTIATLSTLPDPLANTQTSTTLVLFTTVSSPSVAFDTLNNFYVIYTEHNAANTSGEVLLDKYNISNGTVTAVFQDHVLYQWINQDPAFNPVVAVDTDQLSFTDPQQTSSTQTDNLADTITRTINSNNVTVPKAVYVAWNTYQTLPNKSIPAAVSRILVEASDDGGMTFSTQEYVADAQGDIGATTPQILFTQGTATSGRVPGGELMFVWNGEQLINLTPYYDDIDINLSQPASSASAGAVSSVVYAGDGGYLNEGTSEKETINGQTQTVTIPGVTDFTFNVNINDSEFTTLDDLSVALSLIEPNDGNISIALIAPNNDTVYLLDNTVTVNNQSVGGLPGVANLGVINYASSQTLGVYYEGAGATQYDAATGQYVSDTGGTIFEANAPTSIVDKASASPYVGVYQPEDEGDLENLINSNLSKSAVDGTWTLQILDYNVAPAPPAAPAPEYLINWSLNLTSDISTTGFGTSQTVLQTNPLAPTPVSGTPLLGNYEDIYPMKISDSGPNGIGPGTAIAIDNTLGAFSPYQGRIYIAYNGYGNGNPNVVTGAATPNPNVYLIYSDNNGTTWSTYTAVTDDTGSSPKFNPSIAVDPVTGTLVVEYYDGRFDSSNDSLVNSIQTSINGGASFSTASFLNQLNQATDFLTDQTETIEPIPGNPAESPVGFGDRPESLVVYGGQITAVFATNLNSTYGEYQTTVDGYQITNYTTGASIFSTTATFADGPRVVQGDQGPITQDSTVTVNGTTYTYNNTFASDGTRELTGFVITFDRPVDPLSFGALFNGQTNVFGKGGVLGVEVMFRSPTNPAGDPAVSVPVASVAALDMGSNFGPGLSAGNPMATTFLITLATPASAVGTYSYAIGPMISDRIRSKKIGGTTVNGTEMDQDANGAPGQDTDAFAMPDPLNGIPFELPYNTNTEPLIIPGPHVIYTYSQYATPPTASQVDAIEDGTIEQTDNVVVDAGASAIYILFDRDMEANTFESSNVLTFEGPDGPLTGPYTIIADPAGTDPALTARTFEVVFPEQVLSGTYSITFAPTVTDTHGNAVDTNLNAGLYVLDGIDPTNSTTTSSTYTNSTPVNIVPGQTVDSTISVTDAYEIEQDLAAGQDIQVQLNIVYSNDPDLQAELIAPDGTVIKLFTNVGTFGEPPLANFENTTFDDSSDTPIQTASVPFNVGPFDPQEPLSTLDGAGSEGTWTLAITDTNSSAVTGTAQLTNWSLKFPHTLLGTGLGEPIADQFSASFRIFTQSPTDAVSSDSYTAIGPASENGLRYDANTNQYDIVDPNASSGQVNAIAVDPSDPSGNTVYVGGANGGIWKTTDFLTTNPNGPTWTPLANLGPTNSMNISGLAVFGVNNNPDQSVIYAITGDSSSYGQANYPTTLGGMPQGTEGVGILRSTDGGQTWEVLTGLNNVDSSSGNILPMASSERDNTFVGDVGYSIAVDPTRLPNGQIAVYAAFSGPTGGLYRSVNGGNTWTLIKAGNCTDVLLAPGSTDVNGNEEVLYAAFQSVPGGTSGVYMTTSALTTTSLNLMGGDQGVNTRVYGPTVIDTTGDRGDPIPVTNDAVSPNGQNGRIVLATPNLTASPLDNTFYQGWLYAAATNASGVMVGLYMTKDFGNNWTKIDLPAVVTVNSVTPTPYNTSNPSYDPTNGQGEFDLSLAIDPTNPNVVYLGGTFNTPNNVASLGLVRIDTTKLLDVYAEVGYLNDGPSGDLQYNGATGSVVVGATAQGQGTSGTPYGLLYSAYENYFYPENGDIEYFPTSNGTDSPNFLNLYRDPTNPFVNPSSLQFFNVSSFTNPGTGAQFSGFTYFTDESSDFFDIQTEVDPITGETRLIVGTEDGVFTGVDNGSGDADSGEGFATSVNGTRNGNLQLAQFNNGASQPSTLAAQITGALYYGIGYYTGAAQSVSNILTTGDLTWEGVLSSGKDIATDQTGSGTLYQSREPRYIDEYPFVPTDFFLITPVTAGQPPSQITSRTTGLLLAGDSPATNAGEWPAATSYNFTVNPIDPSAIIFSSQTGNVFRTEGPTTGYGKEWFEIATGSQLDSSNAQALAFGAPTPSNPNDLDDFIYAGTLKGHIYVTFNGGGTWTNISAGLDGSSVEQIVTDPRRGSDDAYAVTENGVYYIANVTAANAKWVKLDDTTGQGDLFSLTRGNFDNTSDPISTLKELTSIAVDWRYAIPDNPSNPSGPTHPVIYVGGNGGVYRSLDQGQTWTYYPDVTDDGAVAEGGNLPVVEVSGLNLVLGDINPATGYPDTSSGLNQLVVTTDGSGDYAIRLDTSIMVDGHPLSYYIDQPDNGPSVTSVTELVTSQGTSLTGLQVTFSGATDPTTFTASEIDSLLDPNGHSISVASITNVTPVPPAGQASLNNIYDINFTTPQTITGTYQLSIGPDITDDSGNPMSGVYSTSLSFTPDTPPTITPSTLSNQIVAPGTTNKVAFVVSSTHYNPAQLTITATSSNTTLLPNSDLVVTNTGGNNYSLEINASAITTTGSIMVTISATDPQALNTTTSFLVALEPLLNTTTTAANVSGVNGQNVTLTATVTAAGGPFPVNEGNVVFEVFNGSTQVGSSTSPASVTNGQASTSFTIPSTLSVGSYTIKAFYTDASGTDFNGSQSDPGANGTLNVAVNATQTAIAPVAPIVFNANASQNVTLSATVTSNNSPVTTGSVTFTIAGITGTLGPINVNSSGQASGSFTIPAGAAASTSGYTITATYTAGIGFQGSTDNGSLVINPYGTANHLAFEMEPQNTPVDQSLSAVQVEVLDVNGNVVQNDNTDEIGLALAPNSGALHGTTPKTVVNGIATFNNLNISQTGTGYVLTATDDSLSKTSTSFDITALNTTTTAANVSGVNGQNVTLTATVAAVDSSLPVNEGTAIFEVFNGIKQVGTSTSPASVSNGQASASFSIPSSTQAGSYTIEVFYTDSTGTDFDSSQSNPNANGTLNVGVEQAPVVAPINAVTLPSNQFPDTVTINASSPIGNTLYYSATVSGYNQLYTLEQQYQFNGMGYHTYGATAYVLSSTVTNIDGNHYYLLRSDGSLFAYDGSGSYAHSFTYGPTIASLGTMVYNDPSLLTNALAPIDYATLSSLEQQYQFKGMGYYYSGAPAYVLYSPNGNVANGGFYLLSANGLLFAYDGSGSYAHSFSNGTAIASLGPDAYDAPTLLTGSTVTSAVYSQMYALEQQYDFKEYGTGYYTDVSGQTAFLMTSSMGNPANGGVYALLPDGTVHAYDESALYDNGPVVATLDPSAYADAALLVNAQAASIPAVTTSFGTGSNSDILTLTPPTNFVGTFEVTVSVTDNVLTTTKSFLTTVTNAATITVATSNPTVTIQPDSDQTVPVSQFPFTATVSASSTSPPVVTGSSQLLALQEQYDFRGIGYYTVGGATAYVLASATGNAANGGYYLIRSDGTLFTYDGSGSYAHSFTGTAIASLGANVYDDPSLLTNALAPIDYSTPATLQMKYQFQGLGYYTYGAPAYVLSSTVTNADGNHYYLLRPDGSLFAYRGSGSYAQSFAGTAIAFLGVNIYTDPTLLTKASVTSSVYSQMYALEQQYDFKQDGAGYSTDAFGQTAFLMTSPTGNPANGGVYALLPDGTVHAYDGIGYASSPVIATLDPSAYTDAALLVNAKAPPSPTGVTATLNSGTLTISNPDNFVGTFQITLTATDAMQTTTQSFLITSTASAPTITVATGSPATTIQPGSNQIVAQSQFPFTATVTTSDAEGDAVTLSTPVITGSSQLYALEQQYGFRGLGYYTVGGTTAYVLVSSTGNATNGGYYLIRSDGTLFAYDGSGSYAHSFTGTAITSLGANVYDDPSLLTNALPSVDYSTLATLQQQYQFKGIGLFNAGATAYVLSSTVTNMYGNSYYLLNSDGSLYAYDGSGSYAHSFNNGTVIATVGAAVFLDPTLLTEASVTSAVYSQMYALEQQYDFKQYGNGYYTDSSGQNAFVMTSPTGNTANGGIYTLLQNGKLYAYNGGASFADGTLVTTLDPSIYTDAALLVNAKAPPSPTGVTATLNNTVNSGTLTISNPNDFVGIFQILLSAKDDTLNLTSTQSFLISATT